MLQNTEGGMKNGQSRETGNIRYTRRRNVIEYRRGNQKWTNKTKWQHKVHKTNKRYRIPKGKSEMDKQEKLAT